MISAEQRANFFNLYADILWFGMVVGSSMSFVSVYAARQGASSLQLALLTAGPSAVSLMASLPAGRAVEGRPLTTLSFLTSIIQRLGYLVFILIPALAAPSLEVWLIVALSLLMALPGTVFAIAFNTLLAELIPEDWRSRVVGRRNALLSLTTLISSLLCGFWLDRVPFPGSYHGVFALGALGALLSAYHLSRLRRPSDPPVRLRRLFSDLARPAQSAAAGLRSILRPHGKSLLRGPFGRFMLSFFLFYTFQYISIPIYPLFMVNEMQLTDGQISLGTALFYLGMMATSMGLGRLSRRVSHRGMLIFGGMFYSAYPILNAFAYTPFTFWAASMASGSSWAIASGAMINRLMERIPEDDRPAGMTIYNVILNLGAVSGSLLGPLLVEALSIRPALLAAGGLRFLTGLFFILWG
ncbi:MAG: MFS transporter [Chloroflexi bacterium]|nr:MFS transporter [Chloroflexota bacterium]